MNCYGSHANEAVCASFSISLPRSAKPRQAPVDHLRPWPQPVGQDFLKTFPHKPHNEAANDRANINTCKSCDRPPRCGAAFRAQHDDRKWRSSSVMTALGFPQQASAHGFGPMFPWQRGRDWCNECAISSAYRPSMPVSTRFVPAPWWS